MHRPLFGLLEHDGTSSWQGRVAFPPVSEEIDVVLTTGQEEPGDRERARFLELA